MSGNLCTGKTMKKLALILCTLTACAAAGRAQETVTMTLAGNLTDVPQDTELVYSDHYSAFTPIPMTDGRFSVPIACNPVETIRIDFRRKDGVRSHSDGYTYYGVATIFPEPGGRAMIEGTYEDTGDDAAYTVTGSAMSERYSRLNQAEASLEEAAKKAYTETEDTAEKRAIVARMKRDFAALYRECLAENADNLLGVYCIRLLCSDSDGPDEKRRLLARVPERFEQNSLIRMTRTEIRSSDMEKDSTTARPAAVDQPNAEGESVSLLETCAGNRYTLLDFWASWCAPCVAEFPALTEAYARYRERGFEIYAVSLDHDRAKWEAALDRYELPWIEVGDLRGMLNAVAAEYGVTAIPDNFLLDSAGNVIARGLRGEALAGKLDELFNE